MRSEPPRESTSLVSPGSHKHNYFRLTANNQSQMVKISTLFTESVVVVVPGVVVAIRYKKNMNNDSDITPQQQSLTGINYSLYTDVPSFISKMCFKKLFNFVSTVLCLLRPGFSPDDDEEDNDGGKSRDFLVDDLVADSGTTTSAVIVNASTESKTANIPAIEIRNSICKPRTRTLPSSYHASYSNIKQ